jgi:hypothetical protein
MSKKSGLRAGQLELIVVFRQIVIKFSNIKFYENLFSGSEVIYMQTNMG